MPYYDTIDEDLERARAILAQGKLTEHEFAAAIKPELRLDLIAQSGTIYGKDIFAAYHLLESFVQEIDRLRAGLQSAASVLDEAASIAGRNDVPQLSQSYSQEADACRTLAGRQAEQGEALAANAETVTPATPSRDLRHDEKGQLDDVVVPNVRLFRMERMDTAAWWMRLYMHDGDDIVFHITTSGREITVTAETEYAAPRGITAAVIADLRTQVAAGSGHECSEWRMDGKCQLCDRDMPDERR